MDAEWMPVRQVAALVYPWRRETQETVAAQMLRWSLHLAFWGVLLVVLWQLNRWSGLDRLLRSPWPILHRVWLPLLAVALYPLGWLGLGLWTALQRAPTAGAWPELESAWTETLRALDRAGIDVRTAPTFLVLGPVCPDLQALLESLGAAALPLRADAPFQVFGNRNIVFFAYQSDAAPDVAEPEQASLFDLCRLLMHARAPRHPVQGIIVVAPFDAEQSATAVQDLMTWCRDDLRAVRHATGLELPIYFAVSGLDRAARAGEPWLQRFPPHPDIDPAEIAVMYRLGLDWLCLERIPQQVRRRLQLEPAALAENLRLYEWSSALANWRTAFQKLLSEATQTEDSEPGMVAGCYVLPPAEQAAGLAATLQADLLKHQDAACWTAATMELDAAQRRRAWLGYGLGLLALLGSAALWMACRS
jgi:hypothetical protein